MCVLKFLGFGKMLDSYGLCSYVPAKPYCIRLSSSHMSERSGSSVGVYCTPKIKKVLRLLSIAFQDTTELCQSFPAMATDKFIALMSVKVDFTHTNPEWLKRVGAVLMVVAVWLLLFKSVRQVSLILDCQLPSN